MSRESLPADAEAEKPMNAPISLVSASRRVLPADSFTGVVPAPCDAEAGEHEVVVLDRAASPHAAFGRLRLHYREPGSFNIRPKVQ